MPVEANCSSCGRRYQAPDAMAGKRVRCKQCGTIFELPAREAAEGSSDLDALAEMERSFHSVNSSSVTASPDSATSDDTDSEASPAHLPTRRQNVRFGFSMAREIDDYLPWILILGGVGWLAL